MNRAHAEQGSEYPHGVGRVRLIHEGGVGERVWVAFADEDSARGYRDNASQEEPITAVLLNEPLGWGGKHHGDPIVARSQGHECPVARLFDQR
jgi:hypothetical protein